MQKVTYPARLREMLDRALKDTEGFWGDAARELHWFKPWNRVFEWEYPDFKWFVGGLANISYSAVDSTVHWFPFVSHTSIMHCSETCMKLPTKHLSGVFGPLVNECFPGNYAG